MKFFGKSAYRIFSEEVNRSFGSMKWPENIPRISTEDIMRLPQPIQRYMNYAGVAGKERLFNFNLAFAGDFKLGPKQDWMQITTDQYNFMQEPTRLFYIQGSKMGLRISGRDAYLNGKGNMFGKMLGITLFDERGPEMDIGELVTFLNDQVVVAPGCINDRLEWEEINDDCCRVSISHAGIRVSAKLFVNKQGELVNFETTDRFFKSEKGEMVQCRWSTPLSDYKEQNGVMMCSRGRAIWHTENGPYEYARFTIQQVRFNPTVPKL